MKWGAVYDSLYVNRLYSGVKRHLSKPFRFVCFTDDSNGIREEVETFPIPEGIDPVALSGCAMSRKLHLFHRNIGGLEGTCLYFDLDVVLIDSIDCFFDYLPGEFCICREWLPPHQRLQYKIQKRIDSGNSSVFRYEANTMQFIIDMMNENPKLLLSFKNEQEFLTYAVGKNVNWWPSKWVSSFKHRSPHYPLSFLLTPKMKKGSKVVVFNGPLKPTHAIAGNIELSPRRVCRPTPWVAENWID